MSKSIETEVHRLDPGYASPYVPFVEHLEPSEVALESPPISVQISRPSWEWLDSPETLTVTIGTGEDDPEILAQGQPLELHEPPEKVHRALAMLGGGLMTVTTKPLAHELALLASEVDKVTEAPAERDDAAEVLKRAEMRLRNAETHLANVRARVFKEHPELTAGLDASDVPGLVVKPEADFVDD